MKVYFVRIFFHKEELPIDIENWPSLVLFKGINKRLPVRREYLLGGFRVYK